MSSFRIAALALILAGGALTPAGAQEARSSAAAPPRAEPAIPADAPVYARQGTWFGLGIGAGAADLSCAICSGEQGSRGTSGYLRAGTTVNSRLLIGAEMNGWMRSDESGTQRIMALTANGYWYPNPRHGYYFKGGFGYARYKQWSEADNNADLTTGLTAGGFTGQVGAGYEIRVNPKTSFVPFMNLIATAQSALSTERDDGTSYERNRLPNRANVLLLQLGLGVTWH